MRVIRVATQRLKSLFCRSRVESELLCEIDLHIEQLTQEYVTQGISESEARLAARHEFGLVESTKELCRDSRRVRVVEDLMKDLVYAFRSFRKVPAFALTAVTSLALGIGANTIVFSVLNALLLKPLPIADPDRVYFINNSGGPSNSFPNYRDIRDRNTVFESLFAYRVAPMALGDSHGAQRLWGLLATGTYFQTLGVKPVLGRFFTPVDDIHRNASPYAVLSYNTWRTRFAVDPQIAGREIRLNGRPYTVLGVAPPGFHGTEVFYWAEIWVPMSMQAQIESFSWLDNPNTFNAWIAGRLKPRVTVAQAEANLKVIEAQLVHEHTVNEGVKLSLSAPGMAGSALREPTRAFGTAVMLLASLVLLAACANLAALLMARAADRDRELAIRVSIGAGRGRIVRQLLTESVSLSIAGSTAGLLIAAGLLKALSEWRAPLDFPVQFDVNPDWRVFLFASIAALLTGVLFGIGPALRAWNAHPASALRGSEVAVLNRRWTVRDLLLPVQIALCCVLVTASLVAVRGLTRSLQSPLGFEPDGAALVGYDLGLARYDEARARAFDQHALEEIAHLPGIESAAYSNSVPLSIDQSTTRVYSEDTTDFRPKNAFPATYYDVSPGYFKTIGTRLISGRELTVHDDRKSPAVAVVNQTFARRVIGTEQAVGKRFRPGKDAFVEVVGVVEDGKYETLTETPKAAVYYPVSQVYTPTIVMMVRSHRPESEIAAEMRQTISRMDPDLAVYGVGGLRQMLGLVYLPMRAAAITLGAFGVLALMLSITGIYGLAAYNVSRRSREIGIRMAIGARPSQVLQSVFARIGALVGAGAAAGLVLGLAGARVLASIVYQASSRDPVVIAAAVLTIGIVVVGAALGPARRAIGVDPVQSLRAE